MEKNSIIKNSLWKFSERILSQLVALIVSVILARLLTPDDYGAISMVTIFTTFANILVTSGLPTALIQKKDADKLDFSSVFYVNIGIAIIMYIILFASAPYIASFFEIPILTSVIRVLGLNLIVNSVYSVQHAYVSKQMMFKKFFWSTLWGTVISCIVGVVMAYAGFGVWALVAQYMFNTTIGVTVLFFTVDWRPELLFSFERVKSLFHYGWKILFEGVAETFTVEIRKLIIGKVYTSEDLGFYTKAQQFPNLLVTNVASALSSVLFPTMSNVQDDKESVKLLMRKSISLTSFILFPLMVGLALVAKPFIVVVLTEKWLESVPFLQVFCFTQAATVGMISRHEALKSIGRSDIFMYEHFVSRIIQLCVLFLVYKNSVMAVAWSLVIGMVVNSIIVGYTSKKYNFYTYKEQLVDVLPIIIACVIMGIPVYIIGTFSISYFVMLILQVVVGAIVYVMVSWILKIEGYIYIIRLVKQILYRGKEV